MIDRAQANSEMGGDSRMRGFVIRASVDSVERFSGRRLRCGPVRIEGYLTMTPVPVWCFN
jgi:hypothetical protein